MVIRKTSNTATKRRRAQPAPKRVLPHGRRTKNPILKGMADETRCKLFEHGAQCPGARHPASPGGFCKAHEALAAEGKLTATCCPVLVVLAGRQCQKARNSEGASHGYCRAHHMQARRRTPVGATRSQATKGEGKDGAVTFRWLTGPKQAFSALARKLGLPSATDLWNLVGDAILCLNGKLPVDTLTVQQWEQVAALFPAARSSTASINPGPEGVKQGVSFRWEVARQRAFDELAEGTPAKQGSKLWRLLGYSLLVMNQEAAAEAVSPEEWALLESLLPSARLAELGTELRAAG